MTLQSPSQPCTISTNCPVQAGPAATQVGCACSRPCSSASVNSALMHHGEPFRFARGDVLWAEGAAATELITVCTGVVKLSRAGADNRDTILELVFRGGLAGEEAARSPDHAFRFATCTALCSGKGIRLPADRLRLLLQEHPELCATLFEQACRRFDTFSQRINEMSHGPVENRLARVILRIGDEVGLKDARGTFVPVRLSRSDLSEMVGCRVETTIRVMTRWQREGLVETQREGLVIRDPKQLEEAAHFSA